MVITDSQVHIWGADTPDCPWPPGLPWFRGADLEGVMGRGVSAWLRWPVSA